MLVGRARLTAPKLRFRTRDQRIKRSRGSSKPHINQCSKGSENDCAIECAIVLSQTKTYLMPLIQIQLKNLLLQRLYVFESRRHRYRHLEYGSFQVCGLGVHS